jgi:hypothetical protein
MVKASLAIFAITFAVIARAATVEVAADAPPRVLYGADRLRGANLSQHIVVRSVKGLDQGPEGFRIDAGTEGTITIEGADDSGSMYGCLELARRLRDGQPFPRDLHVADAPVMKLRGPCIGMQKTYILPGRHVYEYPYTSDLFPFFYDKQFWTQYLDFLADNRFNTLYLWSGHPFASLVKLDDYPYALEVSEEQFQKNVEMYRWIATECDRRGIWLVQMFYNILLSKPFAEKNGLETQLKSPNPVAADYTRKSLAEFVKQYPHVGLMICMGEALQGNDNQKQWLCEVLLPGVKDGMKLAGLSEEPPVVLRTHATDLRLYMADALKVYKNIYTEAKFNGESLTTWEPRGKRQQVHLAMSKLGSTHLINVHILANLEPFRYGAQRFIQKCVQAGRDRLGAKGLHLYPLFYWNWPDSPDEATPPLKQWERDWIWFEAWGRYAWNPDVEANADHAYWIERLTDVYGDKGAAEKILSAYNDSGECAPRILRRFGITEGNRQTLSLAMTLEELVDPDKYSAIEELWESQSPPGERLQEYVQKEWKHEPHEGETPPSIIAEVLDFSQKAVDAIDAAHPTKNQDEFGRLKNDVHCIRAMSQFYAAKANAAMCVLRHKSSHDPADMSKAAEYLAESVEHFRTLTKLTSGTYRFANSMQTSQRKIPLPGGAGGKSENYHWSQLLPVYEKELADFRAKLNGAEVAQKVNPLPAATIQILGDGAQTYDVKPGALPFAGKPFKLQEVAPELEGLKGIRVPFDDYAPFEFEASAPVQILIGYFKSEDGKFLKVPNLETDALAGEHGGIEAVIRNAVVVESLPPVDVHVMSYEAGRHRLDVRGRGAFVILGVVPQSAKIEPRDVELSR